MKTVKYEIKFSSKASRLELLIRLIWAIPSIIVLTILSVIGCIALVLQWFHILVMGKRHKFLHDWIAKYTIYSVQWMTYFHLLTEERNPILPEK